MLSNNLAPLWDEAISSMLLVEFEDKQRPLLVDDLQSLALENATRIGDILETLFLMVIYGDWQYTSENGEHENLDQTALDDLYARGRVTADDLNSFQGQWEPSSR